MMQSSTFQFVHRTNPNGTFDSICTQCFQTIANVKDETTLQKFEMEHVCDPHLVKRFKRSNSGYVTNSHSVVLTYCP